MNWKISNTWQHIWLAGLAAFIVSPIVCSLNWLTPIHLAGFATILWFAITIIWEAYRYHKAKKRKLAKAIDVADEYIISRNYENTRTTAEEEKKLYVSEVMKTFGINWIDTIVDLIAGNVPFNLVMWVWVIAYVQGAG